MGVAVQQAESLSLDADRVFSRRVPIRRLRGRQVEADKYALVESVLKRHHYADQKRSVKGSPAALS